MKNPRFVTVRFAVAVVAVAVLTLAIIPSLAQNTAPATAQAARPGPSAPLVMQPAPPQGARRSPASARSRRALPQDNVIYSNGPANLNEIAWVINFGYAVSDSVPLAGDTKVTGFDFYAWEAPGDKALEVDWSFTSAEFGGTTYGSGTASVTDTFVSYNQSGYQIDYISVSGLNVSVPAGTAWLNLQNAVMQSGGALYWDQNSGPSQASENTIGSIPSESFDVTGGNTVSACDPYDQDSVRLQPTGGFNVIYSFTGGDDGSYPNSATVDRAGNIFGTTNTYWRDGSGKAFKVSKSGSGWVLNPLYDFAGYGSLRTIGPEGAPYGWDGPGTGGGGCSDTGCVLSLKPPPTSQLSVFAPWRENALEAFHGGIGWGDIAFDKAGNIYGSVNTGGDNGFGFVYELTPSSAGWTMTTLYAFQGGDDGQYPSPVILDKSGNLYGTTGGNGPGGGTVFELSPSEGGWVKKILYIIGSEGQQGDGAGPTSLVMDAAGNLYGATSVGEWDPPTVFQLMPSDQGWNVNIIWRLNHLPDHGPTDRPAIDAAGDLYFGTTSFCARMRGPDGSCDLPQSYVGEVFKLTPSPDGWKCTSLHSVYDPHNLAFDGKGNLYGTTKNDGDYGLGSIFQITP